MHSLKTAFLLALLSVSALSQTKPCTTIPADEPKVAETMRQFYVAATNDDLALFHAVAASSFYSYDGGARYEGDALMNTLKASHTKGNVYVWTVTDPQVHLACDSAWITYVNKGSVTAPDSTTGPQSRTWLESAFMQKEAGAWKILFFHSTPVRNP